jgi:hypothetical protein
MLAANSDQMNAVDIMASPLTVTIKGVTSGSAEQPVNFIVNEWPKPFRPCKTMRRLICAVWGPKGPDYVGRSMTLFRNPAVRYGGIEVGGIEISHMSHIDKPKEVALPVGRGGKVKVFTVKPIQSGTSKPAATTPSPLQSAFEQMKAAWKSTREQRGQTITADDFRMFVSESTSGRVGMTDAMIVAKYTDADITDCTEAVVALREAL